MRVVDLQSYSFSWGSTGISVEKPVLDGSEQAVDEIEQAAQEWIMDWKHSSSDQMPPGRK